MEHVQPGTTVYSDQNAGCIGLKTKGYTHHSVNHSAKQYVDGQAHTNGSRSNRVIMNRRKPATPRKPRQSKYDEVNALAFKIPDTPENIAQAILRKPPKKWDYLTKPAPSSS